MKLEHKIGDYHRAQVANYLGRLVRRFGFDATLRCWPRFEKIVWSEEGLALVTRRIEAA